MEIERKLVEQTLRNQLQTRDRLRYRLKHGGTAWTAVHLRRTNEKISRIKRALKADDAENEFYKTPHTWRLEPHLP